MAVLNYYAVLDVSLQASQEEIKKAYLGLTHHPNKSLFPIFSEIAKTTISNSYRFEV